MDLIKVMDREPKFLEKAKLFSVYGNELIDVMVTRNPFSETDSDYYWFYKNPRNSEYTWRIICGEDLYQPERSKREDLVDSLIDSQKKIWDSVEIDRKFTEKDFEETKMRYSEH